jgi:predicted DNA-binding transcriptional regulator AlpA
MGQAADLPRRPIPRLAFREQEAADALGIGLTTFHELVAEGRMPQPVRIRPRLPLYDAEDVRRAWEDLKAEFGRTPDNNDFDA